MRAVVYEGPYKVGVETMDDPPIADPGDAIIEITSTGICGSDLHMYEGRTAAEPGIVLGHEIMGTVMETGDAVFSIHDGDRVVLPFNIACGVCYNCVRGFTNACLTANPKGPHAAFGYVNMGPFRGGQADYVRVPFADFNCLKLPGKPGDELEDDFLLLSDVFATGYFGADMAGVEPGSTVAVFGAGPVGLLAAYSSIIRGAAEVYVVDRYPERLKKAQRIGAIPVDFTKGDPVEQIFEMRRGNPRVTGAWRPGEEKMAGVMCGIDAVGYEAFNAEEPSKQKPTQVIEDLIRVVNVTGKIGQVGVYLPEDPGGVDEKAKKGIYTIPWGQIFEKGLTFGTGQCPVKRYNIHLRDLIAAGKAKPSFIVSHHHDLNDAPIGYEKFDKRTEGYTKVILKPKGVH